MEQGQNIDHDRLFKELFTTFFVEFIELFFPKLAAVMDRDSIVFLDKEVFISLFDGNEYEADIVARVRFADREAFFLIHVENQSTPEVEFGRRMLRYFTGFLEKYNLPVYPIVVFSYDKPVRPEPTSPCLVPRLLPPADHSFLVAKRVFVTRGRHNFTSPSRSRRGSRGTSGGRRVLWTRIFG